MQIGHFLTEIIYRAMADVLPGRVIAGSGGTPATMNVFYGKRGDGNPWHSVIIRGGGMGASSEADGAYCYIFPANGANTPVEIFESDTPLLIEKREFLVDSGGPGKMMGGLGRRMVIRVPSDETIGDSPVNLGIQSGRFRHPPNGLFGGRNGARATFTINEKPGNPYGLSQLVKGDVVTMDAAGGGGYGDPLERDPDLVEQDVQDGFVSVERAEKDYRVVVDPKTKILDRAATSRLRQRAT